MPEAETTPTTRRQVRNSAVNAIKAHIVLFPETTSDPSEPGRPETESGSRASSTRPPADDQREEAIDHAVFEICYASAATGVRRSSAISMFRQATAMDILSSSQVDAGEDEVGSAANRRSEDCAGWGAAEPTGTPREVAAKLAYLVKQLAGLRASEDVRSKVNLTWSFDLASCALADLVLMGDRPIDLPASVTAADAPQRDTTSCQCGAPAAT